MLRQLADEGGDRRLAVGAGYGDGNFRLRAEEARGDQRQSSPRIGILDHRGAVQRLRGEGPPTLGKGSRPTRGDIHYRFVIDVPRELTDEQRDAVEALSSVINGNPRESLLRQAAGRS